ncbi:MAG TPA: response regulator transcription factor [Bryobacteraceae bacterium]|nr:response regulator transcription factor [Bryobacteraceae bacterium]
MKRPRLLLADEHQMVREGLQRILEPEFEVVGEAGDGRSLLLAAQRLRPDVALLEITMPLLNGIDAARQLRKLCPHTKLIFLTAHAGREYAIEAFRAGAAGFVLKRSKPEELLGAVRAAFQGKHYLSPDAGLSLAEVLREARHAGPEKPPLTPRQREVLQLVAEGRSNKEVATILNISLKGVEFHKSALARKLGTNRISEWTLYAIGQGLVFRSRGG